ncbi:MAG: Lrp/AsnC family transcriptional regulator [Firmicutes bacterium]|nr:Lrp/AsnC family transcriptional regulator [Bacillota bacterium]
MIDEKDREILSIIQGKARISNAEVARQVGLAPSAVFERIKKLESRGIVKGYEARLDPREMDLGLLAFVFVRAAEGPLGSVELGMKLAEIPEVQEVHNVAGEDCYLLKIRARDTEALWRLIKERLGAIKSIHSTRTTIVFQTIKETSRLPLGGRPAAGQPVIEIKAADF